MKNLGYTLLLLFALAPTLVVAQTTNDVILVEALGVQYEGRGAAFGVPFVEGVNVGPLPLIVGDPYFACEDSDGDGTYEPLLNNAAEVAGNIVLVSRGDCPFVVKAEAAALAGAAAVIVVNNTVDTPDAIILQGGDCEPEVCSVPSVGVSLNTGTALLQAAKFGEEVTLIPEEVIAPPPPRTVGTHNTGVVQMDVFDYGFLGADAVFEGTGFVFDENESTLFVSSVLIGQDGVVNTNPYTQAAPEFTAVSPVETISGPFPFPFSDFDQGFITSFSSSQLGVLVTERSYSRSGDPFVVVELEVENTSGSNLENVYIGLFADWDIGATSTDDFGGVNEDLNLTYVYQDDLYFGVSALNVEALSGYNLSAEGETDETLFTDLTTPVEVSEDPEERAVVTGTGPYSIPAGTSVTVRFAYIGATSESGLFDAAEAAQAFGQVDVEATTPQGTYVLESAYPNPFRGSTSIRFELPVAEKVALKVYDVLGREVATLVDGMAPAGLQTVTFDASTLPSGVYIYRLEAGSTQLVQRVTLVR